MSVAFDDFDRMYRADADPWGFATSPYEQARYAATLAWLRAPRYHRAFEPACSIGVLTDRLAERCDHVVACDVSPRACELARERLAHRSGVDVVEGAVPDWWPDGTFDLVVLSELAYYWDPDGVDELARRVLSSLAWPSEVVAVHWLGTSPDHCQHGATVHDQLEAVFGPPDARNELDPLGSSDPDLMFVIERWTWP